MQFYINLRHCRNETTKIIQQFVTNLEENGSSLCANQASYPYKGKLYICAKQTDLNWMSYCQTLNVL